MFRRLLDRLASTGRDAEANGEYECRSCGARYGRRRQICPACNGFRVERREWGHRQQ